MERVDAVVKALAAVKSSAESLPGDATFTDPELKGIAAEIRDASIGFMKRLLLLKKRDVEIVTGLDPAQASFFKYLSQKERDMIDEICRISKTTKKEVIGSIIEKIAEFKGLLTPMGALLIYIDKKNIRMDTNKYFST